jgi:hypothetical protein
MSDTRTIELTREEALVLFDLLQREIDARDGVQLARATLVERSGRWPSAAR